MNDTTQAPVKPSSVDNANNHEQHARTLPETVYVNPIVNSDNYDGSVQSTSTASSTLPTSPVTTFKLTQVQRLIAGSGHILNDLCASLWFTYFLLYMQYVVKFKPTYAAGLLFWGQVVDGIATPLVGYETDHVEAVWPLKASYGRCKSWHLLGVVLVSLSFPFVFSPCIGYSFYSDAWAEVEDWKKAVYYAPFIAIFQIGWACTQVSHLALIPKLTPDDLIRTEILAIRYACTVAANVSVFVMTWMFLTNFGRSVSSCKVDVDDSSSFGYIAVISVVLGVISSILFHIFVDEKSDQIVKRSASMLKVQESISESLTRSNAISSVENSRSRSTNKEGKLRRNRTPTDLRVQGRGDGTQALLACSDNEEEEIVIQCSIVNASGTSSSTKTMEPIKAFSTRSLNIGKVALLYMSTRLAVNLSQSYTPLYVEKSLLMECGAVAVIPIIMYCSGFCISLVIKLLNKYLGRQLSYGIGTALIIAAACLIMSLHLKQLSNNWGIYVVAVLLGGGSSAILVTSLAITADLIGNNIESGAFVYGAMSFCDKISCGLAVVLINSLNPCPDGLDSCKLALIDFFKYALGGASGGSAIAGSVFIVVLTVIIIKRRQRMRAEAEGINA